MCPNNFTSNVNLLFTALFLFSFDSTAWKKNRFVYYLFIHQLLLLMISFIHSWFFNFHSKRRFASSQALRKLHARIRTNRIVQQRRETLPISHSTRDGEIFRSCGSHGGWPKELQLCECDQRGKRPTLFGQQTSETRSDIGIHRPTCISRYVMPCFF